MNDLRAPAVYPFPPRNQVGKSRTEIARVFEVQAEIARRRAWELLRTGDGIEFTAHMRRAQTLTEAAVWALAEDVGQ